MFCSQFSIWWNNAQFFLTRQCLLSHFIPSLVEFSFILVDPFLWCVMWGVCGTRCKINEERLFRCKRLLKPCPTDGLVRHVCGEVIIRILRNFNLSSTIVYQGSPLSGFATNKSIKLVKARTGRPAVQRTGNRDFPRWSFMVLTERSGAKTILAKYLCHRSDALRSYTRIAWKSSASFHNRTGIVAVVIVTRKNRHPCR